MTHRTCTADGCPTLSRSPGSSLCQKHYEYLRRNGRIEPDPPIDNLSRYTIDALSGCWLWDGPLFQSNSYGQLSRPVHGTTVAHVAFYREHVGPIPIGLQLDHLCRVRHCVNPAHLEPVTPRENQLRGAAGYGARVLCKAGAHDITSPANWYIAPGAPRRRTCLACAHAKWKRRDVKRSEQRLA